MLKIHVIKKNFKKCIKVITSFIASAELVFGHMTMVSNLVYASIYYSNHYGQSDIRAYLNDTSANGYLGSFTSEEQNLIQKTTVETNIFSNDVSFTNNIYETRDKIFLPSAYFLNTDEGGTIYWGKEDISDINTYTQKVVNAGDLNRVIPISYWCMGITQDSSDGLSTSANCLLRSPCYSNTSSIPNSLSECRGNIVNPYQAADDPNTVVAAVFKVDISSILFGSSVSANILSSGKGVSTITIVGSKNFDLKTSNALPSYGMYLKKEITSDFNVTGISQSENNLTVNFENGTSGKYVTLIAYKNDDITNGTTSLAAAKPINGQTGSVTFDLSSSSITNLHGYTIKVWMEDGTNKNLAEATNPQTFELSSGTFSELQTATNVNKRVFALKDDLQCSWGKLSSSTDLVGINSTKQKIYYADREFWIAGREDVLGNISNRGNIMCLYQASSTDQRQFNSSTNLVITNINNPNLSLENGLSSDYNSGNPVEYEGQITDSDSSYSLDYDYQYTSTDSEGIITDTAWHDGMPSSTGNYKIRALTKFTNSSYNKIFGQAYSNPVNFSVVHPVGEIINNYQKNKITI